MDGSVDAIEALASLREPRDGQRAVSPIRVLTFAELQPRLSNRALVKGYLGDGEMSVIYGESNTGKTFFAIDIGMHVSLGWEWQGRRVRQGGVVYIAGEGVHGIQNRVAAFRKHHGIITTDVPFAVIPAALDLRSEAADTGRLIDTIGEAESTLRCPVRLLVVDTLSRALAGGNENSPDDMGAFVMHVDRIRQACGAHVLNLHHSGKDGTRGARGHSLLRAAVDTEIEITRDAEAGISTAHVRKQRELPSDVPPLSFALWSIPLGQDEDGDEITSCVIVAADAPSRRSTSIAGAAGIALNLLRKAVDEAGERPPACNHVPPGVRGVRLETWRRYCYAGSISDGDTSDAKRKSFKRAADRLQSAGIIGVWGEWVWLP
jgi:KaiC/GvpD/RAD55 family RecA-like ATPase